MDGTINSGGPYYLAYLCLLGYTVALYYLDPGLGEVDPHGDLLPRVDVRVVRLLEGALQLLLATIVVMIRSIRKE